jgi:WXG100 family type VII secretion target
MDILKVQFGALMGAAQQVASTYTQLQSQYEDLQATCNRLRSVWDGSAQASYSAFQANWNTLATDLYAALQSMGVGIDNANQNFQAAEQANTQTWG